MASEALERKKGFVEVFYDEEGFLREVDTSITPKYDITLTYFYGIPDKVKLTVTGISKKGHVISFEKIFRIDRTKPGIEEETRKVIEEAEEYAKEKFGAEPGRIEPA